MDERLAHALVHGINDFIALDTEEVYQRIKAEGGRPLHVIEGPLMDGMNVVGDLSARARCSCLRWSKSARVMKQAVAHLLPYIEGEEGRSPARLWRGPAEGQDRHGDREGRCARHRQEHRHRRGPQCNNFEVINMGVMVAGQDILAQGEGRRACIIGLSGLITPSLEEMQHVAAEMRDEYFRLRKMLLLIGGATTSRVHTAVKIAPHYEGPVVYVPDASPASASCSDLLERREGRCPPSRNSGSTTPSAAPAAR